MAANQQTLISTATGQWNLSELEETPRSDIRFYIAILVSLIALFIIAVSKFY